MPITGSINAWGGDLEPCFVCHDGCAHFAHHHDAGESIPGICHNVAGAVLGALIPLFSP